MNASMQEGKSGYRTLWQQERLLQTDRLHSFFLQHREKAEFEVLAI